MNTKKQFLDKWSTWWMLEKNAIQMNEAFEKELNEVITNEYRNICNCEIPNTTIELPHRCVKCNKPIKW